MPASRSHQDVSAQPLDRLEARMQAKWHDLVRAEEVGEATQVLERLFAEYMVALEAFVARSQRRPPQSHVA